MQTTAHEINVNVAGPAPEKNESTTAEKVDTKLAEKEKKALHLVREKMVSARGKVVDATASVEETYGSLKQRAEDAAHQAKRRLDDTRNEMRERYGKARDKARDAGRATGEYVGEHPVYVAVGAAALGFALGWLLASSRGKS